MKFATIGSYLLDDIINYAKVKKMKNYSNIGRYTCINPVSLCYEESFSEDIYTKYQMVCENEYQKTMHISDIRKTVFDEIRKNNPDYVLFDLTEIFAPLNIVVLDNRKLVFTYQKHLKQTGVTVNMRRISPELLSSQELLDYIKKYIDKMINVFGIDKLILVKTFANYQYFDINGKWVLSSNVSQILLQNVLLKGLYEYIDSVYNIKTISLPELLVNDLTYNINAKFKFAELYYVDLIDKLEHLINNTQLEQNDEKILDKLEQFIDSKTVNNLIGMINANALLKKKKLVLIGRDKALSDKLQRDFGVKFDLEIQYDSTTKDDELLSTLTKIKGKSNDYYVVVPHLYTKSSLIEKLIGIGYFPNVRKIGMIYISYQLKNIVGEYIDIYNNHIISKTPKVVYKINGKGISANIGEMKIGAQAIICEMYDQSSITIEDNVRVSANLSVVPNWCAVIKIGKDCTFGGSNIIAHSCGHIEIGADCMFSTGIVVQAGDGHAIYDLKTKENINSNPNICKNKNRLIIGEHVWVGREAFILNATIGNGSIIGARAFVKKHFPNNCIVAGMPAKIIKKDIGWSRETNCIDIEDPIFGVPKRYSDFTVDID